MTFQVINDWVSVALTGIVHHRRDLDNFLGRKFNQNLSDGLNGAKDLLALEADKARETESESLVEEFSLRLIKLEPFLGFKNSNILT